MSVTATKPTSSKSNPSSTVTQGEKYDVAKIPQDFSELRTPIQQHLDKLILINQLFRQNPPTTPYLTVGSDASSNKLTQYTHPLISFFVTKGLSYLLTKSVNVSIPADMNPAASSKNRNLCAKLILRTWRWNDRRVPGRNSINRRAKLIFLEGGYAVQYAYLTDQNAADEANNGYPVIFTLHSLFDIVFDRDPTGVIRRVIVGKRIVNSELPMKWRGSVENDNQEREVYEHWDRINHGVTVDGVVVKPLTAHGYKDSLGAPLCPWVIQLHDPDEFIRGDGDLVSSGLTPLKTLVGTPVVDDLVQTTQHLSATLTLMRNVFTDMSIPDRQIKGQYTYDPGRKAWMFDGDNPQDGISYVNGGANIGGMMQFVQYFQQLGEQGGMGQGLFNGSTQTGISGTAIAQQTAMPKRKLEHAGETLEQGLEQEATMILSMVQWNTSASTAQKYEAKFNRPLPTLDPEASKNYTNGQPMSFSRYITGNDYDQITDITVQDVDHPVVSISPYDALPKEQRASMGIQWASNPNNPYSQEDLLGTYFDEDNPAEIIARKNLENMMKNPQLPFADLAALDAMLQEEQGSMDPQKLEGLQQQIRTARESAIEQVVQQKLQALSQGVMPTSQAQPPGSKPPGMPMPGGSPPGPSPGGIPGMSPGAPQPPMSPQMPPPQPMGAQSPMGA